MMRAATALAAVVALLGGCSKSKSEPKITRDRDAAAVVVVKQTPSGVSYADEAEPNDEPDAAGALELPGGVRGALDGETDVDRYAIDVTEAGWLSVELDGIKEVDLILELQDAAGAAIAKSDSGPAETAEGLPNYPVDPGRYLLTVSEFVKKRRRKKRKPRTGLSPSYRLTARFTADPPAKNQEREPNEGNADAMELLLGVDGFGYLGWDDDADRWRLTFDNFGVDYSLDVDVAPIAGVWMRVDVLDDNGDPVLSRKAGKGEAVAVRNLIPKEGHEHYYVQVSAARSSNPQQRYALRLGSRLLGLEDEREPNDDAESATPLREDPKEVAGTRQGYLLAGDDDWYRLPAGSGAAAITVAVEPPAEVDVTLSLQVAGGGTLGEASAGNKGDKEQLSSVPIPPGKDLLVRVHGDGTSESIEPYRLSWTVGAAAASPGGTPEYDPYGP
jgi:hypothetical protein